MFGVVLRQSKPIVMGCLAIILRVPAVEIGVAAFGPVAAVSVLVFRGQQLGEIEVVLALGGGLISDVGGGVTLVGGSHDLLGGLHPLGEEQLPEPLRRLRVVRGQPRTLPPLQP